MSLSENQLNLDISGWREGISHVEYPCYYWDNLLSPKKCDEIIKLGERNRCIKGKIISANKEDTSIRNSFISWIRPADSLDLYETIWAAVQMQPWGYDIRGFADTMQYTVYEGDYNHFYNWHTDTGPKQQHRKVSFTLQLSDPQEYEGGVFELDGPRGSFPILPKGKGSAFIFPSFLRHRVTPVTKGVRKSLVTWIGGPKLK